MIYLIYIITIAINIYYSSIHKSKKINREDKYCILKENTIKKEILKYLQTINLVTLITNTISIIINSVLNNKLNIIDIIGYFIHLLSYILLINSKNYKKLKKGNETLKLSKEQKNKNQINLLTISSIILMQRVGGINNSEYLLIIYTLTLIFSLTIFINFIKLLINNKNIIRFNPKREEDYLEDIRFSNKIYLKNIINYVAFIFIYILIIFVNLPYSWIIYILICSILLYTLLDKIKKFKHQSNKLIKTIYILKNAPGIKYAFEFYKDIISAKNIIITLLLFITSLVIFYLTNTSAFIIITIELFNIYLYNYICNKKKLIKYISSLNEEFIDKKKYTLEKNFPINYIEEIEIFKNKFYKIMYIDLNENIYSSNLILYDPENILNNIKVYINPNNEEYIMIIKELYE